jgi:hypothetical protein
MDLWHVMASVCVCPKIWDLKKKRLFLIFFLKNSPTQKEYITFAQKESENYSSIIFRVLNFLAFGHFFYALFLIILRRYHRCTVRVTEGRVTKDLQNYRNVKAKSIFVIRRSMDPEMTCGLSPQIVASCQYDEAASPQKSST